MLFILALITFALPRYPLVESYSNMARFQTVVDTPLPVTDLVPTDPLVKNNPPARGFTIIGDIGPLDTLACYLAQFGKLNIERLGPSRTEVRFPEALPVGRNRLNHTHCPALEVGGAGSASNCWYHDAVVPIYEKGTSSS